MLSRCSDLQLCYRCSLFQEKGSRSIDNIQGDERKGVHPNVATYNSLIKHLCKIRRMEKVNELLNEMEEKGGSCVPSDITFNYLLKSVKVPEEVPAVLERMERNGCKMSIDTYNLMLKLYMGWDLEEKVKSTWDEMEKSGLGPNRSSYTIMVHGLYDKRKFEEAMDFFNEMKLKGLIPEPSTENLVNAININSKEEEGERGEEDLEKAETPKPRRRRRKVVGSNRVCFIQKT